MVRQTVLICMWRSGDNQLEALWKAMTLILTNNGTLVGHQRGQGFDLIHRHICTVSDTWGQQTREQSDGPFC